MHRNGLGTRIPIIGDFHTEVLESVGDDEVACAYGLVVLTDLIERALIDTDVRCLALRGDDGFARSVVDNDVGAIRNALPFEAGFYPRTTGGVAEIFDEVSNHMLAHPFLGCQ